MSAFATVARFMLIIVRSQAVQSAARELGTAAATSASRAATAALLRAIRSRRAIRD